MAPVPATTLAPMPPELAVAVCTNRRPEAVAECLAALLEQVPGERLAVITSGLPAAAAGGYVSAGAPLALSEPRPGLSLARNRALGWSPAPLLAFVDDDAVVEAGWYEGLRAAWAEAPERVACIGGPIRPRFEAPPPPWLSDAILPVLTLLDLGARARTLDPSAGTVYGANISFRVEPLRRAGGFDPGFGHSGRRVFFSEEDEAQRALARLGFEIRYDPRPAVRHVIPPERLTRRSFLRRRFAYGRTLGVRRARLPGTAARQLLRSAAGSVAAALARQDALLMERAVRVAENAGVLAGLTGRR